MRRLGNKLRPSIEPLSELITIDIRWELMFLGVKMFVNETENREESLCLLP